MYLAKYGMKINDIITEGYYDDERDPYEHLDWADQWLAKYTRHSWNRWPGEDVINELMERYPNDEPMTLYRGLNFRTKKDLFAFMKDTNRLKTLREGKISSWSPSVGTAHQFSVTRPTYDLNYELMHDEGHKSKMRDHMIGYIGIMLKTQIGPHEGIDVRKSEAVKESEIILPPGEYAIELHKAYVPFERSVKASNVKRKFMSIKNIGDEDSIGSKMFNFIVHNFKEFDDEMKRHLFELIKHGMRDYTAEVKVMPDQFEYWSRRNEEDQRYTEIAMEVSISPLVIYYRAMLLPQHQALIDNAVEKAGKALDREFKRQTKGMTFDPTKKFKFSLGWSLKNIMAAGVPFYSVAVETAKRYVGGRYQHLNSYEEIKKINQLTGREQMAALERHTKEIEFALNQMMT